MLGIFNKDITDPDKFIVTLELVPGRESTGRSIDTVIGIAKDAYKDGRLSAVSITDNPGGNPSLSPDVPGHEIFNQGMDIVIHYPHNLIHYTLEKIIDSIFNIRKCMSESV